MTPARLCLAVLLLATVLGGCIGDPDPPVAPTVDKVEILPGEYLDNRFFFVDQVDGGDNPGRNPSREIIDLSSLHVFVRQPDGVLQVEDVANMAAYLDPTGVWSGINFQTPVYQAARWREVAFDLRLDADGEMECIDLGQSLDQDQVVGICYDVLSPMDNLLYKVGDYPGRDADNRVELDGGELFFRLKLIKPEWADQSAFTFDYVRRNVYNLRRTHIDPTKFSLSIRTLQADDRDPQLDEGLIPYVRVFGLDKYNANGVGIPDNAPDLQNIYVFDLVKGLLYFPKDFAEPFNGTRTQYETNANTSGFFWDGTYLPANLMPEIYDHRVNPATYADFSTFRIDLGYTQ